MSYEITPVIKGEKIKFKNPDKEFYKALGSDGIKKLIHNFYDKIYESEIAYFFPQDKEEFNQVKIKNTNFFIEICGGDKIYSQESSGIEINKFMLKIHNDFSIYEKSRYEWLGIMKEVLIECNIEQKVKDNFWDYLENISKIIVNTFTEDSSFYA